MFDLFMSSLNHGRAYIVTDHNGCLSSCFVFQLMLGLVSHEPHFSLLREEVRFGRQAQSQRPTTPEETTFHLLHLSLLREYLAEEFTELRVGHLPRLMVVIPLLPPKFIASWRTTGHLKIVDLYTCMAMVLELSPFGRTDIYSVKRSISLKLT